MRTSAPSANGEESREAAWNWHGDLTFLMPHKQVPEVPIVTREEPQVSCCNLRKTRSFSPQCEMRPFSSTASREIPPSLLSLKRVLETFDATQEDPRHIVSTREEHRLSSHNSRRAPFFPPHLEMKVNCAASLGKDSRCSHRISRGGGLKFNLERNYRSHATIPKDPKVPIHSR